MAKKEKEYKRDEKDIKESISELSGEINGILDHLETPIEDLFPDQETLPDLEINIIRHDYEKEIELIRIDSKETLECLANLYLDENTMKNKNIYKIIKDDSESLSKLNFSISCAQRALVSCMRNLDGGVNDPLMYQSVAMFQKEMRDTIKMAYELQRKMKDFYKELKSELVEINAGNEVEENEKTTLIGDPKLMNEIYEHMMKDPKFMENFKKDE